MPSDPVDRLLAVAPWLILAVCMFAIYKSVRLYQKAGRVTSQMGGILALAFALGSLAITHLLHWLPVWLRDAALILAIVCALASLVLSLKQQKGPEPKPPA